MSQKPLQRGSKWSAGAPYFLAGILFFLSPNALSGDPGGQRILWINLDSPPRSEMDDMMRRITLESKEPRCWPPESRAFYMHQRPKKFSDTVARSALTSLDRRKLRELGDMLEEVAGDRYSDLDGIVAYTSIPTPRFIGYTRGQRRAEVSPIADLQDVGKIEEAFCLILPDVVRKP